MSVEVNIETHEITVEVEFQEKGDTPYIQDKNWWISGQNTGVRAEAKDGEDGVVNALVISIQEYEAIENPDPKTIYYTYSDDI